MFAISKRNTICIHTIELDLANHGSYDSENGQKITCMNVFLWSLFVFNT